MISDGRVKIAPSVLSADFSRLGEQVEEAACGGGDYIHLDVMDGRFVPSLTFGPAMVRDIRRWSEKPFDVHMMVLEPERSITQYAEAGADIITVHAEACSDLRGIVSQIKDTGVKVGVAIKPLTPVTVLEDVLPDLDLVLVMTVDPGFGGQPFMEDMIGKIKRVRSELDDRGIAAELSVDGGINTKTAKKVVDAGAQVLVAGSAIYRSEIKVSYAIAEIKKSIGIEI